MSLVYCRCCWILVSKRETGLHTTYQVYKCVPHLYPSDSFAVVPDAFVLWPGLIPPSMLIGLRTVRIIGTAIMNTGQTGEIQTKTGRASNWTLPNGSGQV